MSFRPASLLPSPALQCFRDRPRDLAKGCRACRCSKSPPRPTRASVFLTSPTRQFHTSRYLGNDFERKNHYERLNLRYDATTKDIKKSFYALSKTYHPDANRSPTASHTFTLLSESYSVLSHPNTRATYDRDTLRLHQGQPHTPPRGSYSSTSSSSSPAGGRSASGLSRRRGSFRGPPPSFYRNGGWGSQSEKRKQAHDQSTGNGGDSYNSSDAPGSRPSGTASQHRRPGANPFHHSYRETDNPTSSSSHIYDNDMSHFDKESHTRTQRKEDEKRWQRAKRAMGDDGMEFEPQMSLGGHFLAVSAILTITVMAPILYLNIVRSGKKKDR